MRLDFIAIMLKQYLYRIQSDKNNKQMVEAKNTFFSQSV